MSEDVENRSVETRLSIVRKAVVAGSVVALSGAAASGSASAQQQRQRDPSASPPEESGPPDDAGPRGGRRRPAVALWRSESGDARAAAVCDVDPAGEQRAFERCVAVVEFEPMVLDSRRRRCPVNG